MYIKEANQFEKREDYYIIKVQYKDYWYEGYIDIDDYEKISARHWRTSHKKNKVYFVSGSKVKNNVVYMHNYIMDYTPKDKKEIDHIDGNSLNNRKYNLRIVDRQTNIDNTKAKNTNKLQIRGVSKATKTGTYQCDFSYHKTRYFFKPWKTCAEAVYCRYCAEKYYNIETLSKNELALPYLSMLSEEKKIEIEKYVLNKISRK